MGTRRPVLPRSLLAMSGLLATLAMTAGSVWLAVASLQEGTDFDPASGQGLAGLTLGLCYALVGWLIASRRADNPLGWVYLAIGLSQVGESFISLSAFRGLVLSPGSIPGADALSWLGTFAWVPGFGLFFSFSLLLFPTGQLPSRRWRPVAWLAVVALLLLSVPMAIAAWPLRGAALVGVGDAQPPDWANTLQLAGLLSLFLVGIASVISIVARWRHSAGLERQQLKWFTWALVPVVGVIALSAFVTYPPLVWVLVALFVTPVLPLAIGIAVLRYRLYEIDRIVSRTLSWAIVTGLLIGVFTAGVVGLQAALAGVTQGQILAVAASTLIAAALFQPARRRVQRAVDHRFDRARYDGERAAALLADRLRYEVELDAVTGGLVEAARDALRPDGSHVWLRTSR
jgi:hypothetical protein